MPYPNDLTAGLTRAAAAVARRYLQVAANYPVEIVAGNQPPQLRGRTYYWTTPSGLTEIRHPGAYRWPKRYHSSTRRVVVGFEWLLAAWRAELSVQPEPATVLAKRRRADWNLPEGVGNA